MVCLASTVDGVYDASWVGHEVRLDDWPCDRLAVETRAPSPWRSLDDPRLSDGEREDMRRYGQRSCVSLPLIARDKVIGLVDLLDHVEREFTRRDRHRRSGRPARGPGARARPALRGGQAPPPRQPASLELGAQRQGLLHARPRRPRGRLHGPAGRELGWPEERLEEVENVAFLHDIGKIGVSDRVLLKAGPLTSEEWELMRQHPGISAEIVRPLFDEELVAGVRHHHERFDGAATPTAWPARPSRRWRAPCAWSTATTPCPAGGPTGQALSYRQCLAELRRCAARSSTPRWWRPSCARCSASKRRRARVAAGRAGRRAHRPRPHALLRSRADEARPEYAEMVAPCAVARRPPAGALHHELRHGGDQCITSRHRRDRRTRSRTAATRGCPTTSWLACSPARACDGQRPQRRRLRRLGVGHRPAARRPGHDRRGGHRGRTGRGVARPAELQGDRSHTWRRCCSRRPSASAGPRSRPSPTASPASTTTATCTSACEEELERARRRRAPLSLLFCDCDQFKTYNDDYGHKAGDAALARIARIIEACSRRVDLAARYGGEEFVLVLVDTDAAGALTWPSASAPRSRPRAPGRRL
jgi:hypothetical protein